MSPRNIVCTLSHPWTGDIANRLQELNVDPDKGLSKETIRQRREQCGRNQLRQPETKSAWQILLDQFKSIIMALLIAATGISFIYGNWIDGFAIIAVIIVTVAIGFLTEWNSRRSMAKLQELGTTKTAVRRHNQAMTISAKDLVPGDILIIKEGDVIPTDARLLEANNMQADESALTGESVPVDKSTGALATETELAHRSNMLFKGTSITRGSGEAVVVATGMETELGQISALVDEAEEEAAPLEKRLDKLGQTLVWVVLGLSAVIVVVGLFAHKDIFRIVETAVALAVAAVPEGLPIVATVALARGMWRMAHRNALIEKLSAVETLGSTNVIFTDKTGTLTENQMTVTQVYLDERTLKVSGEGLSLNGQFSAQDDAQNEADVKQLPQALRAGILCSNASLTIDDDNGKKVTDAVGEPLEIALQVAGAKMDMRREELLTEFPEVREVAFDSDINLMATIHKHGNQFLVVVKGSPESVIDKCTKVQRGNDTIPLDDDTRQRWQQRNDDLAEEGLRLVALAQKFTDNADAAPYQKLTLLAMFAMVDPPRPEVADSIHACQQAGIRTIMVTGDHPGTARTIGHAVGLYTGDEPEDIVRSQELKPVAEMSASEKERFLKAAIFARTTPAQKLDLIELHQRNNAIVAMTGDGVNDAPALEKADIGVAMGEKGTDVAKEAADVVLLDDAFSSIVAAIEYGRIIFANIRKFTVYLISGNIGEIVAVAAATLVNLPLPLLPLQILYINVLNDVFPSLALGMGGSLPGVMARPPRDKQEPILTRSHWTAIIVYGLLIGGVVLGSLVIALKVLALDTRTAVTISFLTTTFTRLLHVFNMRSRDSNLLRNEITSNPFVWGAILLCTGLLLLAVYWQPFADLLQLSNPGVAGWLLIAGMSLLPLVLGQIAKISHVDKTDL